MEDGSSTPGQNITELSRWLPAVSHREEYEFGWKAAEISEKFPARNTASMKLPEFPGTDRFLAVLSDLGIGLLVRYF
jgi:hypothetical protein